MTADQLTATLAERVMRWRVAPDRFLQDGRSWIPCWRFQPLTRLDNALALLDAADPDECWITRRRGAAWCVTVRIRRAIGKAQNPLQSRAITLAVAQAVGLELDACE